MTSRIPRKVITDHVYPPIPIRTFDWVAFYEGDDERGPRGYGRTEEDAVTDLTTEYPDEELA